MTALLEPPATEAPTTPVVTPVSLRTIEVIPPSNDDEARVTWNTATGAGVKEAAALFEQYRAQGYTAYEPMEGGGGAVIHDFDPAVDIHLMAPLAGG